MTKEHILGRLPRLYRSDPWVEAIFTASGMTLDQVAEAILGVYNSNWFDTMAEEHVAVYEKAMGIAPRAGQTLEDRRSAIEARWKSAGKVDVALLRAVADSWKKGEVDVDFVDGKLVLAFNSIYGVPEDLEGLLAAIDEVKPAHLAVTYPHQYILIHEVHEVMTLVELEAQRLKRFAGGN